MISMADEPNGGEPKKKKLASYCAPVGKPDSSNVFGVGITDAKGVPEVLVFAAKELEQPIAQSKAINMAAWIVALTRGREEFERLFKAITSGELAIAQPGSTQTITFTQEERSLLIFALGKHMGEVSKHAEEIPDYKEMFKANIILANKLGCTYEVPE